MEEFALGYPQARVGGRVRAVKPRHLMLGLLGLACAGACWLLQS